MKTRTLLAVVTGSALLALCAAPPRVRPAGVAGTFYPADAKILARTVDAAIAQASEAPLPGLVALVAPHAGYEFSAHVAGHAYALLKGRKIARVVIIAPTHVEPFSFTSIYDGAAYTTPLGQVPVDQAFAAKLAHENSSLRLSSLGHSTREHSVEVQLPYLQRVLGEFKVVPIVMGDQRYDNCRALGLALAKLMQGSDTLIVASSDLSHFHPYDEAARLDHKTLRAISEWDYLSLSRNFEQNIWEACGGGPIVAAMIASERLGATEARILKYANSGDVTPDKSRVVGYGAVALFKGTAGAAAEPAFSLNAGDRKQLLDIARRSVETAVRERKLYNCPPVSDTLMQERGAFVTLKEKGQLRGCIGYVAPIKPLAETVRDVAVYAALKDTRFQPVTAAELGQLEYEISVLSPLRHVMDVKRIMVGRHGLVMRRGEFEGLLLPQVPVEEGWNRTTFLDQTCLKAGLPQSAWQDGATDIFSFTALVFPEHASAPPRPRAH